MMQLWIGVASVLLVLCAATDYAQSRPDHPAMMMMSDQSEQPEIEPTASNVTDSSSQEDDGDTESLEEEITVQGKASSMCPSRQPEIVDIEQECIIEDDATKHKCHSAVGMAEKDVEMVEPANQTAELTMYEDSSNSTTMIDSPVMNATMKQDRRHHKRSCNYHQCILRKLELLDSMDMPDKSLLQSWASNNITDDKQKELTQERLAECIVILTNIFEQSMDSSKSMEDDGHEDHDMMESPETSMNQKKKKCDAAKKVISCLYKSAECPVIKFK